MTQMRDTSETSQLIAAIVIVAFIALAITPTLIDMATDFINLIF